MGRTPPQALRGHHGVVIGIGWSPNGPWLASSEWDNALRLWNPKSGECLQVLAYPSDDGTFFDGLAWSPDGQRLASATYQHGVQIFDMTARHDQWRKQSFPTWVRGVVWSPDGTQLAGGGEDGILYIWDVDGRLLRQMTGHHAPILCVAWSPGGKYLASGGSNAETSELFVWNVERGDYLRSIEGYSGNINALTWSLNEDILISGGSDGTLRWWDVQNGVCLSVFKAHQERFIR